MKDREEMRRLLKLLLGRIVANRLKSEMGTMFFSPKTYLKEKVLGCIRSLLRPTDWVFLAAIGLFGFVALVEALYVGPGNVSLWVFSVGLIIIAAVLWGVQVVKRLIPMRAQVHQSGRVWSWVFLGSGMLVHISTLTLAQGWLQ